MGVPTLYLYHNVSPVLSYISRNLSPHVNAPETMHSHRGQARLAISEDVNEMDGDYYSGRDRQNYGLLHLNRIRLNKPQTVKDPHKSPHSENLLEVGHCL